MGALTLSDMYTKCARFVDESLGASTDATYTTKTNKMKDGINYAYLRVAKERWKPLYIDSSITLSTDLRFSTTALSETLNEIKKIEDENGYLVDYKRYDDTNYSCTSQSTADTLAVHYHYIPSELSSSTEVTVFPSNAIDETGLCYYGAYMYLFIDEEFSKAERWRVMYEEWWKNLVHNKGDEETIEDVNW